MIINGDIITSRQNEAIVKAIKLRDKKHRDEQRLFVIDGIKLFLEAVSSDAVIETVFIRSDDSSRFLKLVTDAVGKKDIYANTRVILLSEQAFDRISAEKSPEGIICTVKYLDIFHKYTKISSEYLKEIPKSDKIMLLSSVRDPGNIGAIIRSAVAFGMDRLILSSDCADIYGQRAVRAAMGALFKQKIDIADDFAQAVASLTNAGRRVLAAELHRGGYPLDKFKLLRSDCIVIGNEANGIPREISAMCSGSIFIPIQESSESLNASVAASVFMWAQSQVQ